MIHPVTHSCPTLCYAMDCRTIGFPVHCQRPELQSCSSSQCCHPNISSSVIPFFSSLNLSQHQDLFQCISSSYQVAKYWNFTFSISPSNENSGLISFRIDWLDLLAAQGNLKSLLQHVWRNEHNTVQKHQLFRAQLHSPLVTSIHNY